MDSTVIDTTATQASAAAAGVFLVFFIIISILAILLIVCNWRIYKKAGQEGWKAIVPYYNSWVLFNDIIGKRLYFWIFLGISVVGVIPVVNFVSVLASLIFMFFISIDLAKSFGKSTGFGILLALVPFVGYPMLAFGDAQYVGKVRDGFGAEKALDAPAVATPNTQVPTEGVPVAPETPLVAPQQQTQVTPPTSPQQVPNPTIQTQPEQNDNQNQVNPQ